jgi:hypothetical protein
MSAPLDGRAVQRLAEAAAPSPAREAQLTRRAKRLLRAWTDPSPYDWDGLSDSRRVPRDPAWWPDGTPPEIRTAAQAAGLPGARALMLDVQRRLRALRWHAERLSADDVVRCRWLAALEGPLDAAWAARLTAAGLPARYPYTWLWRPVPVTARHLPPVYDAWMAAAAAPDLAPLREAAPSRWLLAVNQRFLQDPHLPEDLRRLLAKRWSVWAHTPGLYFFGNAEARRARQRQLGADEDRVPAPWWWRYGWPGNWGRQGLWIWPFTATWPLWVVTAVGVWLGYVALFETIRLAGAGWGPFLLRWHAAPTYAAAFTGRLGAAAQRAAWGLAALRATEFSGVLVLWGVLKRVLLNVWW